MNMQMKMERALEVDEDQVDFFVASKDLRFRWT